MCAYQYKKNMKVNEIQVYNASIFCLHSAKGIIHGMISI
jgi:hypothetical protein